MRPDDINPRTGLVVALVSIFLVFGFMFTVSGFKGESLGPIPLIAIGPAIFLPGVAAISLARRTDGCTKWPYKKWICCKKTKDKEDIELLKTPSGMESGKGSSNELDKKGEKKEKDEETESNKVITIEDARTLIKGVDQQEVLKYLDQCYSSNALPGGVDSTCSVFDKTRSADRIIYTATDEKVTLDPRDKEAAAFTHKQDSALLRNSTSEQTCTKPVSWADETDDLEGDVSTTWHSNDDDGYRAPPIDRSILPTAPRAAREPDVDRSRLPKSPPFTAFLGNLPYDVSEESIEKFFRGLNISAVRLPREPSNPERLKGFGYAEFDDLDSLLRALSLNEESLGNRRIRVDIADQSQDKERDDRSFGRDRDRNRDSDKTDSSDWRARPSTDSLDDNPPRRGDDSHGDRYRSDRYESDRYRDGPRRDGDRFDRDRGRDRYDDRDRRDYDRAGSRRAFGTGYRRDDDYRGGGGGGGGGDRYGDRYDDKRDERSDKWNGYSRSEDRREERAGPTQRPKLNLKPRSAPKEEVTSGGTAPSSRAASIFGAAKPVDTAAREREVEERLQKEQEKMQQRQLDDDRPRQIERKPRERHPSWRSEDNQERSRTGSESSQTATTGPSSRISRRRESEKSVENEVFGKDDDVPSPSSKSPKSDSQLPLKVMPAPPPKENAWVKRSTAAPSSRSHSSEYSQSGDAHPNERRHSGSSYQRDENKVDALEQLSKSGGHSVGDHSRAPDKREKKDLDSRGMPESKKTEEQAVKFSQVSKYAALSMDGEEETEEYAD